MAASIKALEGMAPNSVEKREETAKQGRCQKCLTKVPMSKQFKVTNDLDAGKVRVGKADEDHSHYCGECKDVRVAMKTSWLENQRGATPAKAKPKGKKAAAKKGKAKAAPKKAAKGKKAPAKKAGRKKAAASTEEPF